MNAILKPGTVISAARSGYRHVGIVSHNGGIYHNSQNIGFAAETSLEVFSGGTAIITELEPPFHEVPAILQRAYNDLGRRYKLVTDNCEHYVTRALGKTPHSAQLVSTLTLLAGAAAIGFFFLKVRK